ncbi:MAG: chemotaxis response regulator protein-glutamate methylesterase [Gammaproteobacteria bacterium]|nr:chemotaxis response regulator protein-glutamate methylesterase [Gammaproteobacteria bacterium]
MAVRVLVVDDSSFFRRQIQKFLDNDPEIEVVGTADNGREAIDKALELKPNVITMDIEMPVMDGISATREIMRLCPTPILMFSSLTTEGARSTLDALEAGALDFIPKRFEDISQNMEEVRRVLCSRVKGIGKQQRIPRAPVSIAPKPAAKEVVPAKPIVSDRAPAKRVDLVAIGTSTGGPVALQKVLTSLPQNFPVPLLLVQHMPGTFTAAFASRLNQICNVTVKEAEDGEMIKAGTAYLAPGGKQMRVRKRGSDTYLAIEAGDPAMTYKPCVDLTFKSIAENFGPKVLAIIMTGMGADGCEGARLLKSKGATIWAQDKETSVIYGMPAAIVDAGIADKVLPLQSIASHVMEKV